MRSHLAVYLLCLLYISLSSGLCLASTEQGYNLTENASPNQAVVAGSNSSENNSTVQAVSSSLVPDINATSPDENATELNATEINATELNATEINATELNATEINATEFTAGNPNGPGKATLVSPKGIISTSTPPFVWSSVNGSTSYQLWIDSPGMHVFDRWYKASDVSSGSICSALIEKKLDKGTYTWKVQTGSDAGEGPWSNMMQFAVNPPAPPAKTTLISPTGTVSASTPTYTWRAVNGATKYQISIDGPKGRVLKQWYDASKVTSGSICSVKPEKKLDLGAYTWRVQTKGDAGDGPWSSDMKFAVTDSKKWTYMVYLDGDNDLEKFAILNFLQMATVGSTSDVNILVQFDRIPGYDNRYGDWVTGKRFYITKGMVPTQENAVGDMGEPDMGDPKTLSSFITWAKENYPAKNYALVMWNHGDGWRHYLRLIPWADDATISDDSPAGKGVCWDDTSNTFLTMQGVGAALASSPVTLVDYDACLMQMIEVSYQDSPNVQVHVGSEENAPGYGNPYDTILKDLTAKPVMTPESLGSAIVQRYITFYMPGSAYNIPKATKSAVSDSAISGLVTAVDGLAQALINVEPGEYAHIQRASIEADYYADTAFGSVDLYDFARLVKLYVPDAAVAAAAQNVMDKVKAAVITEAHGKGHPNANGISICLPETSADYLLSYEGTRFAADTHWDEFLRTHLAIATAFNENFRGSTFPASWKIAYGNWSVDSSGLYSGDKANSWPSVYYNATFSNFTYEAKIFRGGDAGSSNANDASNPNAIVVRGNPSVLCGNTSKSQGNTWDTAYYFQYSRTGKYSIWKSTGSCNWTWIQPWTDASAINKGDAWNVLKVRVAGNDMYFTINDIPVFLVKDTSFSSGKVGLSYYAGEGAGFRVDHATLITGSPIINGFRSE
ncbi:MAG TPA: clostripain-related cysteine peptidase, partial [Methanotrichaceae archaeon]|nr:clostripain-related cysteine peptidase [Methanotrichaceae archaeon]